MADSVTDATQQGVMMALVHGLNTDQLRGLPPMRMPQAVLDTIEDSQKYQVLCRLDGRMAGGAAGKQQGAADRVSIRAVLEAVRRVDTRGVETWRGALDRLESAVPDGPIHINQWSFEGTHDLEAARELATDAAAAASALVALDQTLQRARARTAEQERPVRAARTRVAELIEAIDAVLARHYWFEVRLIEGEMRARRADCELAARKYAETQQQIREIQEQLEQRPGAVGRLLRRGPSQEERERLAERLAKLKKRQAKLDTLIEETELRGWLDMLVNASLYLTQEQWERDACEARLLFYQLLNVHGLQTLERKEQKAVELLLNTQAHKAQRYCSAAEEFLGQYFAQRRLKEGALDRATIQGREPFVRARETMLREYRARH